MTNDEIQELERAIRRLRNDRLLNLFTALCRNVDRAFAAGHSAAWADRKKELALQWFGQRAATSNAEPAIIWKQVHDDLAFLESKGVFGNEK